MQRSYTFGKRGRDRLANLGPVQPAVDENRQSSEARKLVTFGLGFLVAMFVLAVLLSGLLMLTASPDVASQATTTNAAADSSNSHPAMSRNEKTLLQIAQARAICEGLNSSGAGTAPCEVAGTSITIYSNSSVAHARMLCSEAVRAVRVSGRSFEGKWTMYIKSPYSVGQSLAYCQLP